MGYPLSRAIIKERLRWLGHVVPIKEGILPRIVLFNLLGLNGKQVVLVRGEGDINKDLKEMGTSWECVKREALNRLGWRRSVRSCVGFRMLVSY